MIDTREKLKHCLAIERKIYYPNGGKKLPFGIREKDILFGYIKILRKTEYYTNINNKVLAYYYLLRLRKMQNTYAIHIPINVCDEGLSIAHIGPIIIHGECKIGKNLRIHVGVNIGSNGGEPPHLGDNIYIGPGAKIFGKIYINNGCKIGANSVVNKNCENENAILVGVPAQIKKIY